MIRFLVLAFTVFGLTVAPLSAAAQSATPRINPLTGKPYSAASQAEFERQQRESEEQSRMADEAAAEDNRLFQEMRARNAEQIRQFDEAIEDWSETHTSPPGTTETFVSTSYDNDTALGERAEITFYNKWDVPTHKIEFGPDGKPTGPVTQTQQGKVWETIGPRIPPGGGVETSYGEDFDGNRIITSARIYGENGKILGDYQFNFDGVPWRGETRDPETGLRNGGFQDERLKPPERSLGGPLPTPSQVRLITGVCEPCRALMNAHNDLAHRINTIVIEMKSLSEQHQKAYQPAQKPIRMRYDVLAAELATLMPQFEALRAQVIACDKQCRAAETPPETVADLPRTMLRPPQGPGLPVTADTSFIPGVGAIPATNRDLQAVIDAAQTYLAAANCEGMECPVCDCDQAREALQALSDMEAYLRAMQPYMQAANETHMAQFKSIALGNITNGEQRDRTIRAIGLHQFYHNFGSMMLDVASIGSFIKETLEGDGLESMSPYEMLDKLDAWYEATKDLESLMNTAGEGLTGEEQGSPVADLVGGGPSKDTINDTTSTIADAKSVIVAALRNGKDWRAALRKDGAAAALGQIAGRYLKSYSTTVLNERQQALDELLRDAAAGDVRQGQAYQELAKVQLRRQMLDDALAAVTAAKAAYVDCAWRACGPMTLTRPRIPSFVEDVPGGAPKLSWGRALPWFNQAIAETLARMKPAAFREGDCPRPQDDLRTAGDPPPPATGKPQLPPPPLSRPQFERVADLEPPASFCDEFARNDYMADLYNPAVAAALRNARVAQAHQADLNATFTEYMRANSSYWASVRAERSAYETVAAEATARANALGAMYAQIMAIPLVPCAPTTRTATGPQPPPSQPTEVALATLPTATSPTPAKDDCPPKEGREPIVVGPNNKVGSGAQLRSKVTGMATGALLGALGVGGGGGGGSDGPDLWTCKIKDSEYTVFDDPVTGVSLKVGAKRAKGGKLVIFSGIARSPDKGTFQTAFLERPSTGETMAPSDVGPCDLWGEWKLTVSWTKDTYVNGEHVDHQEGGWSETGRFSIPGSLSKVDAPDGLWKRMGFSNASNGAREIGMIFDVAPGSGPLTFVIHVTRPKGDPVMTVPFVLTLTEGPGGKIAFTRAEDPPCPPETRLASTVVSTDAGPPGTGQPAEPPATTTRPPATPSTERPPPTQIFPEGQLHAFDPVRLASGLEEIRKDDLERRKALDAARCEGPEAWRAKRDALLKHLKGSLDTFSMVVGEGRRRNEVDSLVTSERVRLTEAIAEVEALPEPPPTQTCPATPVPEEGGSILDSIEEVFVPA